jgi:DNA polymerase III delta subunit
MKPKSTKGMRTLAVRFAKSEAGLLLGGNKDALDPKLAEALVGAVGSDLGVVSKEITKISALTRHQGRTIISLEDIRSLVRPSTDMNLSPLREALKNRDTVRVAKALDKIRRNSTTDPTMLLLRAKGGPANLALTWLKASLLIARGAGVDEVSSRISAPAWAVRQDIIPAAQRWDTKSLRGLVKNLARADRSVLLGSPSAWVFCESSLFLACVGQKPGTL